MTIIRRVDVFVAGLGPAGARAARASAEAGCSVLACDRKREPGYPVQCAELVPGLIGLDVATPDEAYCQAVTGMGTQIDDAIADQLNPFPGHMIDRRAFDASLVANAEDSGAVCRNGTSLAALDASGRITLSDGELVEARVIIGADGPRSKVGRAIGQHNSEFVFARQLTVPLLERQTRTDIFLNDRTVGGYGWLFPKNSEAHVGVGVSAAVRDRLPELLETLLAQLRTEGRIGTQGRAATGGLIPVGGMLRPYAISGHRLSLLAGDAAGLTNPVTGAGIHAALVSGRLAGEAAAAWLDGDPAAGQDYAEEIEDLFGRALRHAGIRRAALLNVIRQRRPRREDFKRAWIAYPDYWHDKFDTGIAEMPNSAAGTRAQELAT